MNDQSLDQVTDDEPIDENEAKEKAEKSFWSDQLLQFNPSFQLGHPYLQGQWAQYQRDKRNHITKGVLTVLFLVVLAAISTRILFYWVYYIVPALCLGYTIFSYRKWQRKHKLLAARQKELRAAEEVLRVGTTSLVQYSVEEIGQNTMHVLKNAAPNCRIVVENATSVPKYCGSWPIRNWRTLSQSDRLGLHSEYRSYVTGKAWHGKDYSVALLTDSGTVLWFV